MYNFYSIQLADGRYYVYTDVALGPQFTSNIVEARKFGDRFTAQEACDLLAILDYDCKVIFF